MPLHRSALLFAAVLPVACSGPPPAASDANQVGSMGAPGADVAVNQTLPPQVPAQNATTPVQAAKAETDYVGKWTGVEGMMLAVARKPGGGVRIENQWDLDHKGSFDGAVTAAGLRWTRAGETVTAVAGDGDATGLKYLAGKKDCLTVKPGEGYCRD